MIERGIVISMDNLEYKSIADETTIANPNMYVGLEPKNILEPSEGGIGKILHIAQIMLKRKAV